MTSSATSAAGSQPSLSHDAVVEEVSLVVPETDDPSLPVLTFRAWFLGMASCVFLVFFNTFFSFRTQPMSISTVLMQIIVLPIGKLMAATLPEKPYTAFGKWQFSLNPGPFNIKEHVIITVMANGGAVGGGVDVYGMGIVTVMKSYYKLGLTFAVALLISLTTQILGYGWAGLLRRYLVDPVEMWWPSNVAQVSLFRALHEKEPKTKSMTRMQFFLVFMASSFAYYLFPGYLIPILTFFSWFCWFFPHNVTAQQVGSAYHGLGLGSFTLDWAGISAYHGSPLVTPFITILNVALGFVMFIYIIIPLFYWKFNTFDARKFPIFSNQLFTSTGLKYDIDKVLTPGFQLNVTAYQEYSKLYMSPLFALSIGSGFARITAIISHVLLFHGRDIWRLTKSAAKNVKPDIHAKLMKSYKQVPDWWYLIVLLGSIPLPLLMSFVWRDQMQLPWWAMLLAFGLASLVTLPVITYGFAGMPPATPSNIASWIITGMVFNYVVFRYKKDWWSRYNYVLSAALDAGTAFMGVLLFFALQNQGRDLKWWGTDLDHCPLASCPTAPAISVNGCPVF